MTKLHKSEDQRRCRIVCALLLSASWIVACGDDDGAGGAGGMSGAMDAGDLDGSAGDRDAGPPCDLSGSWITQHHTRNTALGAPQLATNWNYHRIEQTGDGFTIVESYDCGYVVRGTTDVSLADAALEAMARMSSAAVGTEGTFAVSSDGSACDLRFDRIYAIRGANKATVLDAVWQVGDPPVELDAFDLPSSAAEGMEDWDADGHEGVTQLTGIGDRYTAQLDWHALHGRVPQHADQMGGEDVIIADYDMREAVSLETSPLLRTSSVPMSPGYGFMVRVDPAAFEEAAQDPLATCRQVQTIAVEKFGNPPSP